MNKDEIYLALCEENLEASRKNIELFQAERIAYTLDNIDISIKGSDIFYTASELSYILKRFRDETYVAIENKLKKSSFTENVLSAVHGCYDGSFDFGHTAPNFDAILELGFPGLGKRAKEYSKKASKNADNGFFDALEQVYCGAERFLIRASREADKNGASRLSACLLKLAHKAPESLYEATELILIFYALIHECDATDVRTLGRLDALLQPYYESDIVSGRLDEEGARSLVTQFLGVLESYKINANLPFAIGGEVRGRSSVCKMTYLLLEAYIKTNYPHVKLHFLYNERIPKDLMLIAFEGIRRGANSIVFLCDRTVKASLVHVGASPYDAEKYSVVGCYECGAEEEITCSCNGKFNILKALEVALFCGKDPISGKSVGISSEKEEYESFEEFFEAFSKQLAFFAEKAASIVDIYEAQYPEMHTSPFLSSTYISCLESGRDIYSKSGAKYCNSSLNGIGIGSAADSLAAIKKLVFEEKLVNLSELKSILLSDWQGYEELRLTAKNRCPKYGMGDSEVDEIAQRIVRVLDKTVSGRPNVKGGVFRLGLFSIDWRVGYGKNTLASADGRKRGELISLNSGCALGSDKNGITAHILSVATLGGNKTPNGTVLDLDLHSSAVKGEAGLDAMLATLETYEKSGGFAVHYNVLDKAVLEEAAKDPEKYPNLQVRLCGWNALFRELSPELRDDFMKRAEF